MIKFDQIYRTEADITQSTKSKLKYTKKKKKKRENMKHIQQQQHRER